MKLVSMSISKEGEKRRYLPLEIRMQMYDDVIELRKQGLSYRQIQKRIYEKYERRISLSRICYWINGKHTPFGKINEFNGKPSVELLYIIGAILSDGCRYFDNRKKYHIELEVKDYEFAEEFGKCLAKVLKRNKPYKPFWNEKLKQWVVKACSILFYKFLDRPLEELKPCIEHSKDTVSAFLRALFDGDGSMHKSRRILKLHNTNRGLLNYAKYLLKKYFDIDSTGPHLNDKIAKTKKDYYCLYICANSLLNFYKYVGFTIKRKQERLIKAIEQELFSFFLVLF